MPSSSSSGSSRGAPSRVHRGRAAGQDQALRPAPRAPPRRRRGAAAARRTRRTRARGARSAASTARRSRGRRPRRCATSRSSASSSTRLVGDGDAPDPCRLGRPRARRLRRAPTRARRARPCRPPGRAGAACPRVCSAGRDHQLRPVELGDVLVAAGRHRGAQAAHQVERAVVLVRGAGDDLLAACRSAPSRRARRAGASGGTSPCPSGSRGPAPRRRARAASRSSPRRRRRRSPSRRRRRCACRRRR